MGWDNCTKPGVASKELPGAEQKLPDQDKFLSALPRPPAGLYAVENSRSQNSQEFHRARMPYKRRFDFGGHFLSSAGTVFSREGVFQQPRLVTTASLRHPVGYRKHWSRC
jgi:hypothetical protein